MATLFRDEESSRFELRLDNNWPRTIHEVQWDAKSNASALNLMYVC
jgi:hypothetical protein